VTRLFAVPSDIVFLLSFFSRTDVSSKNGPVGPESVESAEVLWIPGSRILDFFFRGFVFTSIVGAVLIISGAVMVSSELLIEAIEVLTLR